MRTCVLMQEALRGKQLEDLSPEEQDVLKGGGVAMMGEGTTLAEAELQFSRRGGETKGAASPGTTAAVPVA